MSLTMLDVSEGFDGSGIAGHIEQINGDRLTLSQGTLYPVFLKLEQEAAVTSEWALRNITAKLGSIGK